jgi:hypothetical protein
MRKQLALFIVLLQFPILLAGASLKEGSPDAEDCSKDIEKAFEAKAGNYSIRVSHANDRTCQRLDIFKKGKNVFHEEGFDYHYFLGTDDDEKHFMRHLTGHGTQLVITRFTGGGAIVVRRSSFSI